MYAKNCIMRNFWHTWISSNISLRIKARFPFFHTFTFMIDVIEYTLELFPMIIILLYYSLISLPSSQLNFPMRTSNWSTPRLAFSPWLTLVPTPTDLRYDGCGRYILKINCPIDLRVNEIKKKRKHFASRHFIWGSLIFLSNLR